MREFLRTIIFITICGRTRWLTMLASNLAPIHMWACMHCLKWDGKRRERERWGRIVGTHVSCHIIRAVHGIASNSSSKKCSAFPMNLCGMYLTFLLIVYVLLIYHHITYSLIHKGTACLFCPGQHLTAVMSHCKPINYLGG